MIFQFCIPFHYSYDPRVHPIEISNRDFLVNVQGRGNKFFSGGVRISKKFLKKLFLLYKSPIPGGVRPPQPPPGPTPLPIQNGIGTIFWNFLDNLTQSLINFGQFH